MSPTVARLIALACLFFPIVAIAQTQPAAKAAPAKPSLYDSPQAVGDAFIAAMAKKDWRAGYRCFARDDQDLLNMHLISMTQFAAASNLKDTEPLKKLWDNCGFEYEKASDYAKTSFASAKALGKPIDGWLIVKVFGKYTKDKEGLFAENINWLDTTFKGDKKKEPDAVKLIDVKTDGDKAKGALKASAGDPWKLEFRKTNNGWLIVFPESAYEGGSWNGIFLTDYLDHIHGWGL